MDVSTLADPNWDKPIPGAYFTWEGVSYPVLQAKEDKSYTLNNERIPESAKPWRGTNLLHTKGVRVVPHSIVWLGPRTFVRIPD